MINPFLRNLDSIGEYLSYPLIRFITGILLIPHGYGKLYKGFNGNLDGFINFLDKEYSNRKIEKFCKKLKIFQIGYSWGSFESLITFPSLKERFFKNTIKGNLVRIYCGLEDSKDQINDIERALKSL